MFDRLYVYNFFPLYAIRSRGDVAFKIGGLATKYYICISLNTIVFDVCGYIRKRIVFSELNVMAELYVPIGSRCTRVSIYGGYVS